MENIKAFLLAAWRRLTSSKVAWMSVPTALLPFCYILLGTEAMPDWFTAAWAALWTLLSVFIGTNDPTSTTRF